LTRMKKTPPKMAIHIMFPSDSSMPVPPHCSHRRVAGEMNHPSRQAAHMGPADPAAHTRSGAAPPKALEGTTTTASSEPASSEPASSVESLELPASERGAHACLEERRPPRSPRSLGSGALAPEEGALGARAVLAAAAASKARSPEGRLRAAWVARRGFLKMSSWTRQRNEATADGSEVARDDLPPRRRRRSSSSGFFSSTAVGPMVAVGLAVGALVGATPSGAKLVMRKSSWHRSPGCSGMFSSSGERQLAVGHEYMRAASLAVDPRSLQ